MKINKYNYKIKDKNIIRYTDPSGNQRLINNSLMNYLEWNQWISQPIGWIFIYSSSIVSINMILNLTSYQSDLENLSYVATFEQN